MDETYNLPVGECSHGDEAAGQVTTQNEADEDGKRAWSCEPVALEGDAATVQEHQGALQSTEYWEDVHEWVTECLGLLSYCHGSDGHFSTIY